MKKKLALVLAGTLVISALLSGCSSNEISNDNITLKGYKGIEVPKVDDAEEVTDEQVEQMIQYNLKQNAETEEVKDRVVESGDTVDINYNGKMDGKEFDGGTAENQQLVIGSGSFIDGFEDSIIGHKAGDTFDWEGAFPENYTNNPDFSGKAVVFTITVNSVKVSKVPELTDDYVKTVSKDSKTVDEYKKEVKKALEEDAKLQYDTTLQTNVWTAVLDAAEVKQYPEKKLKTLKEDLLQQYKDAAEYYDQDFATFLKEKMGVTEEEFEKQVATAAESTLKQQMVAEAIGKKEKLEPSDKEYEKKLEELAETYGYADVDALKEAADEDDLKSIVLQEIVKAWLAENCVQVVSDDK